MGRRPGEPWLVLAILLVGAAALLPNEVLAADEGAPAPTETPSAEDEIWLLAKAGKGLMKEGQEQAGLAKLAEAATRAERLGLSADDRATLHTIHGYALLRVEEHERAVVELRRSVELTPKEASVHADLATALLATEDFPGAIAAAERALALGLPEDDAADARKTIAEAKDQRLHQLFAADVTLSFGYDSNVLQGQTVETIAGVNVRQPTRTNRRLAAGEPTVAPQVAEAALPLTVGFGLEGRAVGFRGGELWIGYRFYQLLYPFGSSSPPVFPKSSDDPSANQDSYNFQEHRLPIRLQLAPWSWLLANLRLEGVVNLSGLSKMAPYQGGLRAAVDGTFIESPRFRTKLSYAHDYAAMLDRSKGSGCEAGVPPYQCFDSNRDAIKLTQELRIAWFRAQLAYQFTSYLSGDIEAVPRGLRQIINPETGKPPIDPRTGMPVPPIEVEAGKYRAPTSYFGHQPSLQLRFKLPAEILITASASYEHRGYRTANSYTPCVYPQTLAEVKRALESVRDYGYVTCAAYGTPRDMVRGDHRVAADLYLRKELSRGFGLELGYSLLYNFSNIENPVDNRNYNKHSVVLTADYSY